MKKKEKVPSISEIENNFNEWKTVAPEEIERIKKRNENFKSKEKKEAKFTARLSQSDFDGLKRVAVDKAIPYQTLLGHVIHEYVNGNLVDIKEVQKAFPNIKKSKVG